MIPLLIVNDNKSAIEELASGLEKFAKKIELSIKIFVAESLLEAREVIAKNSPLLTFLNPYLVKNSVDDALAFINEIPPPVIIISSVPPTTIREGKDVNFLDECLSAGAEDYIVTGTQSPLEAHITWMRTVLKKYPKNVTTS